MKKRRKSACKDSNVVVVVSSTSLEGMKKHPKYRVMVVNALKAIRQQNGTPIAKIVNYIKCKYQPNNADIRFLVERTLDWMKCKKMVLQPTKGNYILKSETCRLACSKFSCNKSRSSRSTQKSVKRCSNTKRKSKGLKKPTCSKTKIPRKKNSSLCKCSKLKSKCIMEEIKQRKRKSKKIKPMPKRCSNNRKSKSTQRSSARRNVLFKNSSQRKNNNRQMVVQALTHLNQTAGSTLRNIVTYIECAYGLENIEFLVQHTLKWMVRAKLISQRANGKFVLNKRRMEKFEPSLKEKERSCNSKQSRRITSGRNSRCSTPKSNSRCSTPKRKTRCSAPRRNSRCSTPTRTSRCSTSSRNSKQPRLAKPKRNSRCSAPRQNTKQTRNSNPRSNSKQINCSSLSESSKIRLFKELRKELKQKLYSSQKQKMRPSCLKKTKSLESSLSRKQSDAEKDNCEMDDSSYNGTEEFTPMDVDDDNTITQEACPKNRPGRPCHRNLRKSILKNKSSYDREDSNCASSSVKSSTGSRDGDNDSLDTQFHSNNNPATRNRDKRTEKIKFYQKEAIRRLNRIRQKQKQKLNCPKSKRSSKGSRYTTSDDSSSQCEAPKGSQGNEKSNNGSQSEEKSSIGSESQEKSSNHEK